MDEKKEVSDDNASESVEHDAFDHSVSETEDNSGKFWVITLVGVISLTRIGHVSGFFFVKIVIGLIKLMQESTGVARNFDIEEWRQGRRQKFFQEGWSNGKRPKNSNKGRKIALLSLYLLYLYHVSKSEGLLPPLPTPMGEEPPALDDF